MTIEIKRDNFDEVVSRKGIVLVDCWASWCRNCDDFADAFRRSAFKHPDQVFGTLDTEDQKDLRNELGIEHIPSLLLYRDGVLLFKQPGSYDEATLDSIIAQAKSLDMNRVRAEMASMKGSGAE